MAGRAADLRGSHELGARIAQALTTALDTEPVTVMASIWPAHLTALTARPTSEEAVAGDGGRSRAIEQLLTGPGVVQITVPDDMAQVNPGELETAARTDPRITAALATAAHRGRMVQVLAAAPAY